MYEELVTRLRNAAQWADKGLVITPSVCLEAADAIEELQAQINGWIVQERKSLLKSVPRWIPVTELPEEKGNYLVVINCPRGRWDEICAFDGGGEWVSIDEYAEVATKWVTHWMSLPEPPKAEEGE